MSIRNAYFTIGLHKVVQQFCRFPWRNITYKYKCIMFGLIFSARVFTKFLIATLDYLRTAFGILVQGHIDNLLLEAREAATCMRHAKHAILVLQCLEFEVNFAKYFGAPPALVELGEHDCLPTEVKVDNIVA